MNLFDQMANNDAPKPEEAEVKLDLCGMEKPDALQKLDSVVKYCKSTSVKTLYISFDPVKLGAGQTLFQPVARYVSIEKRNGYVIGAVPLMTPERGGLFVTFKL